MKVEEVENSLRQAFPGDEIEVQDPHGDGYHLGIRVVSDKFEGLITVKRHQLIYKLFQDKLASGDLHALTLVTKTRKEAGGGEY